MKQRTTLILGFGLLLLAGAVMILQKNKKTEQISRAPDEEVKTSVHSKSPLSSGVSTSSRSENDAATPMAGPAAGEVIFTAAQEAQDLLSKMRQSEREKEGASRGFERPDLGVFQEQIDEASQIADPEQREARIAELRASRREVRRKNREAMMEREREREERVPTEQEVRLRQTAGIQRLLMNARRFGAADEFEERLAGFVLRIDTLNNDAIAQELKSFRAEVGELMEASVGQR